MISSTQPSTHAITRDNRDSWMGQAWQLLRQAPITIFAILMLPLLVEGACQLLLPAPYNMFFSKWVVTIVAAGIWPILHHLSTTGKISIKSLSCHGWLPTMIFSALLLINFIWQLIVGYWIIGDNASALLLFGQPVPVEQWQLGLIFTSALPISLLFMFAPARLLIGGETLGNAINQSIHTILSAWKPMLLLLIVHFIVVFLAPFTAVLSVLIAGPYLVCLHYVAYRTFFGN